MISSSDKSFVYWCDMGHLPQTRGNTRVQYTLERPAKGWGHEGSCGLKYKRVGTIRARVLERTKLGHSFKDVFSSYCNGG